MTLQSLHDVLASKTHNYGAKSLDSRVKLITKKFKDNLYIIAVNRTGKSVQVKIEVPNGIWREFSNKNASFASEKGRIMAHFAPWGVKIYMNAVVASQEK